MSTIKTPVNESEQLIVIEDANMKSNIESKEVSYPGCDYKVFHLEIDSDWFY